MADNKYTVRGVADMTQHDSAIKKSASEVYKYKKQVEGTKASILKLAKGGLGALGTALGVAGGAMAVFNTAIKTNQQLSDKWGIAMEKAKTSYQTLISSVSSADFSHLISGLRDVSAAAEKAYKAMDDVATQKILSKGNLAEYNAKLTEAKYNFKIGKGSAADVKYWEGKIEEEMNKMLPLLQTEMQAKIDKYVGWNTAKSGAIPYGYDGIIEWANKGEQAISKEINDLQRQLDNTNRMTQGWLWQQLDNKIKVLKAVRRKLTDGEMLDDVMGSIESYWNYRNSIYQTKLGDTRYTKPTTSTTSTTSFDFTDENRDKVNEIIRKYITGGSSGNYVSPFQWQPIEVNKEIEESEIQAAEVIKEKEKEKQEEIERTNKELEKQRSILDLQISSISSLGSALSTLGSEFDIKGLNIAGTIASSIANIIKGYSEASAQSATLGPWAWAAFSLAGLAQVAGIVSQIHSLSGYASGGIIQGANTIGDYNLARVNSGEMILNGTQQARLFNLLNGSSVFNGSSNNNSGQVEFKIKGQELVGVLNNYNKKIGRVI